MPFTFNESSTRKIAEVVRRVLGESQTALNPGRGGGPEVFWRLGKTTEAVAKGANTDVTIYGRGATTTEDDRLDKGSEIALESSVAGTNRTVSGYSRMNSIDASKWVYCYYLDGGWEIVQAEC